jgi:hypothetical protein
MKEKITDEKIQALLDRHIQRGYVPKYYDVEGVRSVISAVAKKRRYGKNQTAIHS